MKGIAPRLAIAVLGATFTFGAISAKASTPEYGGNLNIVVGSKIPSYDGHIESTFGMIHPIRPFYSLLIRENPDNPDPLPMPLQGMITFDAMRRTSMYAGSGNTQDVSFNAAGQVIGQVNQIESVKDVVYRIINEYLDSLDRLNSLLPKD